MAGLSMENIPGIAAVGAVLGGAADRIGPQAVKKILDIIDSPMGNRFAGAFREAAKRGPQAVAVTHSMLLKKDPEYKAAFSQGGE